MSDEECEINIPSIHQMEISLRSSNRLESNLDQNSDEEISKINR